MSSQALAGHMVIVRLNARLRPLDRGQHFEDPLDSALKAAGQGEVSGAGTMLGKSGEVDYCDIELMLPAFTDQVVRFLVDKLEELGAPKGSKLIVADSDVEHSLGKTEGIAVYLNGTDLPDEVYTACDLDFVHSEFNRLLGPEGRVLSSWQGPKETALYMYGPSFAAMKSRLDDFLTSYPLCQACRTA
jgi:hypothetical protein